MVEFPSHAVSIIMPFSGEVTVTVAPPIGGLNSQVVTGTHT